MVTEGNGFKILEGDSARLAAEKIATQAGLISREQRAAFVAARIDYLAELHEEIGGGEGTTRYRQTLSGAVEEALYRLRVAA